MQRTSRRRRQRSGSILWISALAILVVVAAFAAPSIQKSIEKNATAQQARRAFPQTLEPFPDLDGEAFFLEHHERCFDENYAGSLFSKRLDRMAYAQCVDGAYAERMRTVAVLEDPELSEHTNPNFIQLRYTVRVLDGQLPQSPIKRSRRACGGGHVGTSEGPTNVDLFTDLSEGVYRASTLEGLQAVPCRLSLTLAYGRWPLGEPLEMDLPASDGEAVAADRSRHEQLLADMDQTADCVRTARAEVPSSRWGEVHPPIRELVRDLGEQDLNARRDAARALAKMDTGARAAVPALLDGLLLSGRTVVEPIVDALPTVAPHDGDAYAPVLRCLLEHPYPAVRTRAAISLTRLNDAPGVTVLAAVLSTPDETTQLSALNEMWRVHSAMKPVLAAALDAARSDPSPEVRKRALSLLPLIDSQSNQVAEALQAALGDPDPDVRKQADSSLRYLKTRLRQN